MSVFLFDCKAQHPDRAHPVERRFAVQAPTAYTAYQRAIRATLAQWRDRHGRYCDPQHVEATLFGEWTLIT